VRCRTIEKNCRRRVGIKTVKLLTLGPLAFGSDEKAVPLAVSSRYYWLRTLYTAAAAPPCARTLKTGQVDACFLGGLLMDAGRLSGAKW